MTWISVKERLPEPGKDVLAEIPGWGLEKCWRGGDTGQMGWQTNATDHDMGIDRLQEIEYWQPLPEAPAPQVNMCPLCEWNDCQGSPCPGEGNHPAREEPAHQYAEC